MLGKRGHIRSTLAEHVHYPSTCLLRGQGHGLLYGITLCGKKDR